MQQISFHSPDTVGDACELLERYGNDARILAGGQSLVQMLKQRLVSADHIVDISDIDGLDGITVADGRLWVGATETYADVQASSAAADAVPVLSEMIETIGDTQIRNQGTLVGGVVHADPDGDPPVLATAMDATVRLRSARGERTVTGSEFYQGFYETSKQHDEVVTAVGFPVVDDNTGTVYESHTPRDGDYAVVSVGATATVEEETVTDASVAVGSVSERPLDLSAVSEAVVGERPTEKTAALAARTAVDHVSPFDEAEFSAEYKTHLVERLVESATASAFERARH